MLSSHFMREKLSHIYWAVVVMKKEIVVKLEVPRGARLLQSNVQTAVPNIPWAQTLPSIQVIPLDCTDTGHGLISPAFTLICRLVTSATDSMVITGEGGAFFMTTLTYLKVSTTFSVMDVTLAFDA